eukprot:4246903-Lingulodinium_polyedra.AAC.1
MTQWHESQGRSSVAASSHDQRASVYDGFQCLGQVAQVTVCQRVIFTNTSFISDVVQRRNRCIAARGFKRERW